MENSILINKLIDLIKPVVLTLGYEFYYIEFVNEEGENYLRVYIDNEKGISLEDCEKVSRKVSELLDEVDPIDCGYYLEVSSPGIFRTLFTDEHLNKYIESNVAINLNELFKGKRKLTGQLISFDKNNIVINNESENITLPRNIIKVINLEEKL